MAIHETDICIIGGGITSAMLAQKLSKLHPDRRITVVEAGRSIFDAQNKLLRSYTPQIDSVTTLDFDIDPQYLWAGTAFTLTKIRLGDGVRVLFGGPGPLYLAVNGEQRPAAAALATDIPTLSPSLLFALAFGLILLALQRLRA